MHIKPQCDVESAEDFSRYYNTTYMESRDGKVLQVAGHHGTNVVLKNYDVKDPRNDEEAYVMLPWRKVQTDLVYGRPASCFIKLGKSVYTIHMSNNRQNGRGFRAEYYQYTRASDGNPVRWTGIALEHDLAKAVYQPQYTTLRMALTKAFADKEESILDQNYAVVCNNDKVLLCRKWETVGQFVAPDDLKLYKNAEYVQHHMRDVLGFDGRIKHATAA